MTTAAETIDQAEPEIPFLADPPADAERTSRTVHLARCTQCDFTVTFEPSVTGTSFFLVGSDAALGIGPNGRPVCPNGHDEMEIADDQIPATEAIAQTAERLKTPEQRNLPGIIPPFNYQGAYLELEAKAVEVDELHREYVGAAEEARDAKKAWDKAAELFTKMAIEFQRRRREKVTAGDPIADVDPTRCTFEQLHPDQTCPICASEGEEFSLDVAPKDSARHAEQAQEWLDARAVTELLELLEDGAQMIVPEATVKGWSDDDRALVTAYAVAVRDVADPLPARPTALGTMHVAGTPTGAHGQACTQCDAVLIAADVDASYYDIGWLVGTDCKGKPKAEADHHYPEKTGKKKAARKGRK